MLKNWKEQVIDQDLLIGAITAGDLFDILQDAGVFCESPIEQLFFEAAKDLFCFANRGIIAQYEIHPYHIDFALPPHKIAIEIDGHEYHKTKEQRRHDAQRDCFLIKEGWKVIRFTGSEVFKDAPGCIQQVKEIIDSK